MSTQALNLDWRDAPSTRTILRRFQDLLHHISVRSSYDMTVTGTMTGKNGAKICFVDDDGKLAKKEDPDLRRLFACGELRTTRKRQVDYLCQLSVVIAKFVQIMYSETPMPQRQFQYHWKTTGITVAMAKTLETDLALTMKIHPYAFGVIPDCHGTFMVPKGFTLKYRACHDIFKYINDNDDPAASSWTEITGPSKAIVIPSLIIDLEMVRQKKHHTAELRAVIVSEHRNLSVVFQKMAVDGNVDGVMFLMTGGFADATTRSMLNLLERDFLIERHETKFLYISDRDPHGAEIFFNLKYGSMQKAYCSLTTACSSLKWAGLSGEKFTSLADKWPAQALDEWVREQTQNNTVLTEEQKSEMLSEFQRQKQVAMVDSFEQPSAQLNFFDKDRLRHIYNFKLCTDKYDAKLYEDLVGLGMNRHGATKAVNPKATGGKLAIANLSKVTIYGVQEGILSIMEDEGVLKIKHTRPEQDVAEQMRATWNQIGSQEVVPQVMQKVLNTANASTNAGVTISASTAMTPNVSSGTLSAHSTGELSSDTLPLPSMSSSSSAKPATSPTLPTMSRSTMVGNALVRGLLMRRRGL